MTWDDFQLSDDLLRGIYAYGFEIPSDIQRKTIPIILEKKDLVAQAQSGSGKTGAFLISSLQSINTALQHTQVLILLPTHELVKQVHNVASQLSYTIKGINIATLIGGTSIREDAQKFRRNPPHMVIGTTGRVLDMIEKNILKTDKLSMLVLDEADEMLSKGFNDKLKSMFVYFPIEMQIVLFSATMPRDVVYLSQKFMRNPEHILVKREELSLQCITQFYIASKKEEKYKKLKEIFSLISTNKTIIYCNTVDSVVSLYKDMKNDDFSVECLHGNMTKTERMSIYEKFRVGDTRVLISSDLTARGIDIQQISMVVNYEITPNTNTYLHRIGRSGRYGRKGWAINFVTKQDLITVRELERVYNIDMQELPSNFQQLL